MVFATDWRLPKETLFFYHTWPCLDQRRRTWMCNIAQSYPQLAATQLKNPKRFFVVPPPTQHRSSHPIPLCPPKALLLLVCIASRWRSQPGVMRDAVSSVANTMSWDLRSQAKPLHVCTLDKAQNSWCQHRIELNLETHMLFFVIQVPGESWQMFKSSVPSLALLIRRGAGFDVYWCMLKKNRSSVAK